MKNYITHQTVLEALFSNKALKITNDNSTSVIQLRNNQFVQLESYTEEEMALEEHSVDDKTFVGIQEGLYWFEENRHFNILTELTQITKVKENTYEIVDCISYKPNNISIEEMLKIIKNGRAIVIYVGGDIEPCYYLLQLMGGFLRFYSSNDKQVWELTDIFNYIDLYNKAEQFYVADRI